MCLTVLYLALTVLYVQNLALTVVYEWTRHLLDDRGADAEHLAHRVERPVEVLLENLALTVLCVPHSPESGLGCVICGQNLASTVLYVARIWP